MLGFKGPRKMTIIIPGMNLDHERVDIKPRGVSITCLRLVNHSITWFTVVNLYNMPYRWTLKMLYLFNMITFFWPLL